MRQRANIVRTLAYEPEVILMDEPFGPLDAQTRLILQNQLLELWHEERKTIIFITHDLGRGRRARRPCRRHVGASGPHQD